MSAPHPGAAGRMADKITLKGSANPKHLGKELGHVLGCPENEANFQ